MEKIMILDDDTTNNLSPKVGVASLPLNMIPSDLSSPGKNLPDGYPSEFLNQLALMPLVNDSLQTNDLLEENLPILLFYNDDSDEDDMGDDENFDDMDDDFDDDFDEDEDYEDEDEDYEDEDEDYDYEEDVDYDDFDE